MAKKKILVVDDDEMIRDFLKAELALEGYDVRLANDGVEGVILFLEEKADFVLMDLKMPKLSGVNALRIIKKISPSIPIVTFTGHAGSGEMSESVRHGAVTCLSKPVKFEDLLTTIKSFI